MQNLKLIFLKCFRENKIKTNPTLDSRFRGNDTSSNADYAHFIGLIYFFIPFFLSGCTLFEPQEPLPLYSLESGTFQRTQDLSISIAIDEPLSEASLNTTRIALTPAPFRRDYLANGAWPNRLPLVFQRVLLQGLGQKWGEAHVNRFASGIESKYLISSELQDFSVHYCPDGEYQTYLQVTFKVIDLKERKVITAKTFTERSTIPSFTLLSIVETFNQSTHSLINQAGEWVESVLKK